MDQKAVKQMVTITFIISQYVIWIAWKKMAKYACIFDW